jgi:uncharacterized membrane protein YeaQ/YmgE (transglycosylase-associated protein family)
MLGAIIGLIVVGLVAGFVARALIPGRQEMTLTQTALLGIVGSFVGGALTWLIFDTDGGFVQTASWIGSIVGATLVLGIRQMLEGGHRPTALRR